MTKEAASFSIERAKQMMITQVCVLGANVYALGLLSLLVLVTQTWFHFKFMDLQ